MLLSWLFIYLVTGLLMLVAHLPVEFRRTFLSTRHNPVTESGPGLVPRPIAQFINNRR